MNLDLFIDNTRPALESQAHDKLRRKIIIEWGTAQELNLKWVWAEVANKIAGRMDMSSIYVIDRELTTELRLLLSIAGAYMGVAK